MQTLPAPTTAIARALWGQPLLSAVSADFKKGTVTFATSAPIDPKVRYVMVAEPVALAAMAEDEHVAGDGDVILSAPTALRWRFTDGGDCLTRTDHKGNEDEFRRRRFCPDMWINSRVSWHPSHWRYSCSRVAADGSRWMRETVIHVMDDFGMLVPVPEHLQ